MPRIAALRVDIVSSCLQERENNVYNCHHIGALLRRSPEDRFDDASGMMLRDEHIAREEKMKALVYYLVKSLADHPEQIMLSEHETEDSVLLELKIAPDDFGKIIGKNGNTINAIRTVLQAAASSQKKRVKLEVIS